MTMNVSRLREEKRVSLSLSLFIEEVIDSTAICRKYFWQALLFIDTCL